MKDNYESPFSTRYSSAQMRYIFSEARAQDLITASEISTVSAISSKEGKRGIS